MNYEYLWKVLEAIILELRSKDVTIPSELVHDLKSAQTFINIYRADSTALEVATEIELYLDKVESNLMYLAESDVSEEYSQECLKRISEARMQGLREKAPVRSRFIAGVPRNDYWIRIEPSGLISDTRLDTLIEKFKLSRKPQDNGHFLIHGKKADIKAFIKEISETIQKKKSS